MAAQGAGKEGTRACLAAQRRRAGHSQESLAQALTVDTSTVVRWEGGLSTPRPRHRPRLAAEIEVDLGELDGLLACRSPCRRDHRRWAPGPSWGADRVSRSGTDVFDLVLGGDAGRLLGVVSSELPAPARRVGCTEVEVVRAIASALAGVENRAGGVVVMRSGLSQLRWAASLLDSSSSAEVRAALHEAVGNLAEVVGFCAFDDADLALARRCFGFALRCATEVGCWGLRAAVLADLARVDAQLGDADAALSAVELAQVRSDRISATGRAMLYVMRARYLVLTGRDREALDVIDRADGQFDERDPSVEPPWLGYYDEAEHHGSVGRALLPVAVSSGRVGPAATRLAGAIRLQPDQYPRSRLFSSLRLARLHLTVGDPGEAAELGAAALKEAKGITSRRVTDEFAALLRSCETRAAIPEVADLRDWITQQLSEMAEPDDSRSVDRRP